MTFASLFLKGKICTAVRFVTLRGVGGVLLLDNIDLKLGQLVIGVLRQKHQEPIVPAVEVLEYVSNVPPHL